MQWLWDRFPKRIYCKFVNHYYTIKVVQQGITSQYHQIQKVVPKSILSYVNLNSGLSIHTTFYNYYYGNNTTMDFSYKNYVKRFSYQEYQWPPDIALAELHSRCSEPGPPNPNGVSCPCCGFQTKQRITSWLHRDIYQDFKEWGAGIPAYFGLLRFYTVVAFLIVLINGIYPLYTTYFVCNSRKLNQDHVCVNIGEIQYLAYPTMRDILGSNGYDNMVVTLDILQAVVFYVLLIANNLSIFYLVYINNRCKSKSRSRQRENSLLIENLPWGTTQNSLKALLNKDNFKPKIKEIVFVKEIKTFAEVFKQRIRSYFSLKALYVESMDPKKEQRLNDQLIILNGEYHKMRQVGKLKNQKAIVVFETKEDADRVYQNMSLQEGYHWLFGFKAIFTDYVGVPVFASKMPELPETRWVNLGQNHTAKMTAKIQTFVVCVVLILICYALFYYPLKFSLRAHADAAVNSAKLTVAEKFLPVIISLAMLGMSIGFRHYMQILAEKRSPKTYLQQSQFILATTVMFHLIFYQIVPTLFFVFSKDINDSIKLYTISEQARTFVVVQIILSFIDFVYRMWKSKKTAALSDQRQGFRFPQRYLHERVEYREYPLQLKLMIMFKIWSLSLFYSLELAYISILIAVSMTILYFLEKRNIYHHYTQRKFIGVDLEIKFLNIYINFFCIYLCLIYCLNAQSYTAIYVAIASTIGSLACQIIYWNIINKRYQKAKERRLQARKSQLVADSTQDPLIKDEDGEIIEQTYGEAYREFLSQYNQKDLDKEINDYIDTLLMTEESVAEHSETRSVRKPSVIQMNRQTKLAVPAMKQNA